MRRTPGSTGRVGRPACDDSAAIAFRALLTSKEEREGMREGRQEGIKRRAPKILSQIRALEKIRGILSGGGGHGEGGGREAARRVVDCELRRFLLGRDPDERVVASSAGSRKRRTSIRIVPVGSDEPRKTTRADRSASTAGFLHRRRVRCKNTISFIERNSQFCTGQHAKPRSSLHIGGSPRPKTIDDAPCSYSMRCARGMT